MAAEKSRRSKETINPITQKRENTFSIRNQQRTTSGISLSDEQQPDNELVNSTEKIVLQEQDSSAETVTKQITEQPVATATEYDLTQKLASAISKKKKAATKRTRKGKSIYLPPYVEDELDKYCRKNNVSASFVIRALLVEAFHLPNTPPED